MSNRARRKATKLVRCGSCGDWTKRNEAVAIGLGIVDPMKVLYFCPDGKCTPFDGEEHRKMIELIDRRWAKP